MPRRTIPRWKLPEPEEKGDFPWIFLPPSEAAKHLAKLKKRAAQATAGAPTKSEVQRKRSEARAYRSLDDVMKKLQRDFEAIRKRIRRIEAKALRKLRRRKRPR